jgi:hypothetical protein
VLCYCVCGKDVRGAAGARDTGRCCEEPKVGSISGVGLEGLCFCGRAVLMCLCSRGCSAFACLLYWSAAALSGTGEA